LLLSGAWQDHRTAWESHERFDSRDFQAIDLLLFHKVEKIAPRMAAPGLKNLESRYSVHETIDRLVDLLGSKGLKMFARLDQAAEAQAVGISMRPMELLIFGDPKTGSPLMNDHPSLAIDLPLKALAWESEEKKVYLSFNTTEYLVERHHLEGEPFKPVETLFAHTAN
jgi:uncharacterized protein (DUF302 family)